MAHHRIRKGLDLPIDGAPARRFEEVTRVDRVALLADDYPGLSPRLLVTEGEEVMRGQPLFEDRHTGVRFVAPGAGRVIGIHRGERRVLHSVVVHLALAEREGAGEDAPAVALGSYAAASRAMERAALVSLLRESGLVTAFRTRPYGRVPSGEVPPHAIFVTAIDTEPLAAPPEWIVEGREDDFERGLAAITALTDGPVYLCVAEGSPIGPGGTRARRETFSGPHPAGLPGTHIHFLDPVRRGKVVWYVGYQDVIAFGELLRTGRIPVARVVALGGPLVREPRLLRTRLGACLEPCVEGSLVDPDVPARIISGSVLSGKAALGEVYGYLGRYHTQISVIREGQERKLLGWLAPGRERFSVVRAFLSSFLPPRRYDFSSATHGSARAMVPIGTYERVMPLDILPTFLLRALVSEDLEQAELLGALELEEEDLALCTFVCPGKTNYGAILRHNLEALAKEEA
ncbi:MAG: Na(+)-translocating NADH-quinone reductase subunit A [Myxococcales bacterium]|nr:Na(+)-translocating NADH-quinone reductase subunit A [Myxococcales bacterium]